MVEKMTLQEVESRAKEIFPDYFVEVCKDLGRKDCVRIWNKPDSIQVYPDGTASSLYMAVYIEDDDFLIKVNELLNWIKSEVPDSV